MRQVDATPGEAETALPVHALLRAHVTLATSLAAAEMGLDPVRALAVPWKNFSQQNSFHGLAADARAMGFYLTATTHDIPASTLARAAQVHKQQVSRWLHRVEDLRDNRQANAILERLEQLLRGTP